MDFDFSDEQLQLRDAVGRWVEKAYTFDKRRAIVKAGGFDAQAYQELAELGLAGLLIDESHGGLGMGPVEMMLVQEELGKGIVMEPILETFVASQVLSRYASSALQAEILPALASAEKLCVLATTEKSTRYRLDQCQAIVEVKTKNNENTWWLTGHKCVVPFAQVADAYFVPAMLNGKMVMLVVKREQQGVETSAYRTQDGAVAGDVRFHQAQAQLLTEQGLEALEWATDVAIAGLCAQAVGAMDKVFATTADYLNTRKQFGVSISSFQALRHRFADMKMQLELARSMSYYATLKLNTNANERKMAMARAKYQLGVSMRFVGQQAVQLHGGIAMTDEYIISHYFKRLTQIEMTMGDTLHHLAYVSNHMQETAGVFV